MTEQDQKQLDFVLDSVTGVVGRSLVGAYLYGSAVLGGLRPHSDIDVFVLLNRRTSLDQRRALVGELLQVSGRRGTRISGRPVELTMAVTGEIQPWPTNPRREFQYGEWLRDDYESGFVPKPVIDPDLAPLVATLLTASQSLIGPAAATLLDPVPNHELIEAMRSGVTGLLEDLDDDTANVLLTLARIAYTVSFGRIVSKDEAAAWALTELPADVTRSLAHARSIYLDEADNKWAESLDPKQTAIQLVRRMIDPATG